MKPRIRSTECRDCGARVDPSRRLCPSCLAEARSRTQMHQIDVQAAQRAAGTGGLSELDGACVCAVWPDGRRLYGTMRSGRLRAWGVAALVDVSEARLTVSFVPWAEQQRIKLKQAAMRAP